MIKMVNKLKKAEKYYRNPKKTQKIIKNNIRRKKHIVHGGKALNAQLPSKLDKYTEDWDVFTNTPRKTAKRVERKLDKSYKGDYFRVEEAQHKGTYKLKSNVTNRTAADYTRPEKKVPYITKGGIRYASLSYFKKHIKGTLRDPDAAYRHIKDQEVLQRIQLAEKQKRRRKRRMIKKTKKPIVPKPKQLKAINLPRLAGIRIK